MNQGGMPSGGMSRMPGHPTSGAVGPAQSQPMSSMPPHMQDANAVRHSRQGTIFHPRKKKQLRCLRLN